MDGQIDRHDLTVAFCNFANTPKNRLNNITPISCGNEENCLQNVQLIL
jgi:hypothetical protein